MYTATKTKLAIADEITFLRTALRETLSKHDYLQVIFDVPHTAELFQKLSSNRVDVLLLDEYTRSGDVRDLIISLKKQFPYLNLVVLSFHTEYNVVNDLLDLGINGFLSKSADIGEIVEAIQCASQADIYKNSIVTEAFYWKAHNRLHRQGKTEIVLSETEKKIIQLLWEEKNTQEIAHSIFASVSTVEKLKQKIKTKIDTQSVVGIIKYGLRERIIKTATLDNQQR
jgi:two-component system nitrate/nitrite response regulator NarL